MKSRITAIIATLCLSTAAIAQNYDVGLTRANQGALPQSNPSPQGVPLGVVANGSFETNGGVGVNTFANWVVVDQAGGNGSWFAQTGVLSPTSGFAVNAPSAGAFAAMTDQGGPGNHVLYQDITIPASGGTLNFDLFINNLTTFSTGAALDFNGASNQQFRADIMTTAAGDFDLGAPVLQNLYQTNAGDAMVSGYSTISVDMGAFAGQTVRLRFAEVDNQGNFNVGVDNVTVTGTVTPLAIPAIQPVGMMILAVLLLLAFGEMRRRLN